MRNCKLIQLLYESGQVERVHALPHHGTYKLAEHQWGCLMLLLILNPEPSLKLIKAVAFHDVPERWTGDAPAPFKWADGNLAKMLDLIDARISRTLGIHQELTAEERSWLHAVDRTELLLWAKAQLAMGNANAHAVIGSLAHWFEKNPVPKPVVDFIGEHKWTRHPDTLPEAD